MMKRALAWLLVLGMLLSVLPALGEEIGDGELPLMAEGSEISVGESDSGDPDPGELAPGALLPEASEAEALAPGEGVAANGARPECRQEVYLPGDSLPESDVLFAGYVERLFGVKGAPAVSNAHAGDQLTGAELKVYDYLLPCLKKVTAGKAKSTHFVIPKSVVSADRTPDLDGGLVIGALVADCPWEMFWLDKSAGVGWGYSSGKWYFEFAVAPPYAAGTFKANSRLLKSARTAANTAKNVVKANAGASDYDKLTAYAWYICAAADYNYDAAAYGPYYAGSDPWQLIYVFDGDPATNVVCEGYSKAFQYLCDLSAFSVDIRCITVTGSAFGGGHMWNLVRMGDGKNYLVDVTNSDINTVGMEGDLFLAGYDAKDGDWYGFSCMGGSYGAWYAYDGETRSLFPAAMLKLSKADYDPAFTPTKPASVSITKGKKATMKVGKKLKLKARLKPSGAATRLTWKSSNPKVASVSSGGIVTAKKAGKATITVTTKNKKKASITITVKK